MALAETFQRVVDSLPDDWTDLELDLRIHDEERYIDASVYLAWSLLKAPADVTKGVKSATQVRRSGTSTPGGAPTIRRGGPGGAAGGRRA